MSTIRRLFSLPVKDWSSFIKHKHERLKSLSRSETPHDDLAANFQVERVTRATLQAVARYAVRKYPGRILNIVASKRHVAETVTDTRHVWPEFGGAGSKAVQVAATNSGQLLVTPHVEEVTKHLRAFLAEDTHNKSAPLANVI